MATCKDCFHVDVCRILGVDPCPHFEDRSRFVELKHAEWEEHEDMYGDPFYSCSNCREKYFLEEWTPIENRYFYCPNCGAKMDEQALKEAEV